MGKSPHSPSVSRRPPSQNLGPLPLSPPEGRGVGGEERGRCPGALPPAIDLDPLQGSFRRSNQPTSGLPPGGIVLFAMYGLSSPAQTANSEADIHLIFSFDVANIPQLGTQAPPVAIQDSDVFGNGIYFVALVIPAKAGIHAKINWKCPAERLDSRYCGNDPSADGLPKALAPK